MRQYPNTGDDCDFGVLPIHDYPHGSGACSVTGGYVHRGPGFDAWLGLYVAGDFCGRLFVLDETGAVRLSKDSGRNISSFGEDEAGRIYAAGIFDGKIYRVRFKGPRP